MNMYEISRLREVWKAVLSKIDTLICRGKQYRGWLHKPAIITLILKGEAYANEDM